MIELILAMTITLGVGLVVFQLFSQNEAAFQDQSRILEMQQTARAVAAMIADEIRMAGQGVPLYSALEDGAPSEPVQAFLDGTDATAVRIRAGARNAALSMGGAPGLLTLNVGQSLAARAGTNTSSILNAIGPGGGRFVYIWGPTSSSWSWVRAEVDPVTSTSTQLVVVPRQMSTQGGAFAAPPHVALEEGVSFRLDQGQVLRGETTQFTSLTSPSFTENSIGDGFTALEFTYFDGLGNPVDPTTLELRNSIRRVDFRIAAASDALSTGQVQTYAIAMSVYPRNLEIQ